MLALAEYRSGLCQRCGGVLSETTAPENEDRYRHGLPYQCFRCLAYSRAAASYEETPHNHTLLHVVTRKAGVR